MLWESPVKISLNLFVGVCGAMVGSRQTGIISSNVYGTSLIVAYNDIGNVEYKDVPTYIHIYISKMCVYVCVCFSVVVCVCVCLQSQLEVCVNFLQTEFSR
jgi:hypothetical protein